MEEIIFNPIKDRQPSGPLKKGDKVSFSFRIKQDLLIDKLVLQIFSQNIIDLRSL